MEKIQIVSIHMVKEKELEVEYGVQISCPQDTVPVIQKMIGNSDREHMILLTLDTKNKITSISIVSIGSLNMSIVHPREIFKIAILANAASIIIAHSHPSWDCNESKEDIVMTRRLIECGDLLGIELLDHIIVGGDNYISLREKGII